MADSESEGASPDSEPRQAGPAGRRTGSGAAAAPTVTTVTGGNETSAWRGVTDIGDASSRYFRWKQSAKRRRRYQACHHVTVQKLSRLDSDGNEHFSVCKTTYCIISFQE